MPKSIKKGDRSGCEIEIRSCQNNPNNFKIEIFSFDQNSFNKCFDYNNQYINNSVLLITVFFNVKNLKYIDYIRSVCDVLIRKLFKVIPKEIKDNFKFFFRYIGNNIFIDFYLTNNEIIQAFLDTGINLSEYDNFYLTLNSSFIVEKLLTIYELNQLYYDIFSFVFNVKASRINIDYLLECFQNVIKNHKFNNQENVEETINSLISLINLSTALKKFKLELDAKKVIDEVLKLIEIEKKEKSEKFVYLENYLKEMGRKLSKALLSQGLLKFSQVINLDQFNIYIGVPKYKNGIALMFNIQGLTRFVSILINYIFFLYWKSQIYM